MTALITNQCWFDYKTGSQLKLWFDKVERGAGVLRREEGSSFNLTNLVASGQPYSFHLPRCTEKFPGIWHSEWADTGYSLASLGRKEIPWRKLSLVKRPKCPTGLELFCLEGNLFSSSQKLHVTPRPPHCLHTISCVKHGFVLKSTL